MTTKPQVTIVGLGLIGASIGLGLKASAKNIHVVGHDIDHGIGRLAQKKGAVDKSVLNLISACEGADLVVIATPITAIRDTLAAIGPHLKQGCVVTDTATLKAPVLAWAAETLPSGTSFFVGGDPVLKPDSQPNDVTDQQRIELARGDLFQNTLYTLCPSPETQPTAIKRVADMANLLEARAFFVDPVEHDGMRATVEGLPILTSLALMAVASGAPGWQEARKLAERGFGLATASLSGDTATNRAQVMHNVEHLLPRLDAFINELTRLRGWLSSDDPELFETAFDQGAATRNRWFNDWKEGKWDEELADFGIKGTLGSLGDMLGLGMRQVKPKEE